MDPARWQRIDEVFAGALEQPAGRRGEFLDRACGDDAELRREVESLLANHGDEAFLSSGGADEAMQLLAPDGRASPGGPTLAPGTKLGPYEIAGPLGAGGMGEVYRARDTRLDRTVAIKVLPSVVAHSPALRQRFEREARAISALNHPHICVLHDVGQQDGIEFLVMEHLEGETLAARLSRGALPLDQALRFAVEIARALDAAHRKGIVHRDLKPANVMITKSGTKLLDFGIAKLAARSTFASTRGGPPTAHTPLTTEGMLLGTLQYMSPEQLESREPDARSDIFAFGAVMHEMVTGRRCFDGTGEASVIAAIIKGEAPPLSRVHPLAPPSLDRVVARCLAKDPDDRWQSAGDVATQLEWLAEARSSTAPPAAAARPRRREWVAWAVAAALGIAAIAFAVREREQVPVPEAVTASLPPPPGIEYGFDVEHGPPALSPDGRRLAFIGVRRDGSHSLWVRDLSRPTAQELGQTSAASYPFWSPDGRRIGFFARGSLHTIDAAGGSLMTVCDARHPRGGAWGPGDVILIAQQFQAIQRVAATGGIPQAATKLSGVEVSHRFPRFLPNGHFLYLGLGFAGSPAHVSVARLGSTDSRLLLEGTPAALYAHPGWILFWRGRGLVAQRLNMQTLALEGEPIPLVEPVRAYLTTLGGAVASVAGTQALVYQEGFSEFHAQLTWFDRGGHPLESVGPPGDRLRPSLSNDGRRLAVDILDASQVGYSRDVWIFDQGRTVPTRFTFEPGSDRWAVWSPDDRIIAYSSARGGRPDVFTKETTGTAAAQILIASEHSHLPAHWSADGRFIALQTLVRGSMTGWDVFVYAFEEKTAKPFLHSHYAEVNPRFSPDAHWVAYASDESGRSEVYVQPFPGPGNKFQVSTAGGGQPVWRRDGKELFYREANGRFMAVPIARADASFEAGQPQPLFEARSMTTPGTHYDVAADGQRFIVSVPAGAEGASPLTVVLNWPALLRR
jgi:serine/threonine protein kinase/Tol biopolymer transport system component